MLFIYLFVLETNKTENMLLFQALGYMVKKKTLIIFKLIKASIQYKNIQYQWSLHSKTEIIDKLYEMFSKMLNHTIREW